MTNQMEEDALFFSFAMTGVLQLLLQVTVHTLTYKKKKKKTLVKNTAN